MKKRKIFCSNIFISVLLIMVILSCSKPDENPLLVYNSTSATIGIKLYYHIDDSINGIPVATLSSGEYYTFKTGETCSLHVLHEGTSFFEIQKNGVCVKRWHGPLISRPDSECHSFYNLQSWKQLPGEKKHECARFIFTIREEDLKE